MAGFTLGAQIGLPDPSPHQESRMHTRRSLFVGAFVLSLCLIGASCTSDSPTNSDQQASETPSLDGIGWQGGGGRMPGDTTTAVDSLPRR